MTGKTINSYLLTETAKEKRATLCRLGEKIRRRENKEEREGKRAREKEERKKRKKERKEKKREKGEEREGEKGEKGKKERSRQQGQPASPQQQSGVVARHHAGRLCGIHPNEHMWMCRDRGEPPKTQVKQSNSPNHRKQL